MARVQFNVRNITEANVDRFVFNMLLKMHDTIEEVERAYASTKSDEEKKIQK